MIGCRPFSHFESFYFLVVCIFILPVCKQFCSVPDDGSLIVKENFKKVFWKHG